MSPTYCVGVLISWAMPGGELPDGLELLRLTQLTLEDLVFGDVGPEHEEPVAAVAAQQRRDSQRARSDRGRRGPSKRRSSARYGSSRGAMISSARL